MKIKLILFIPIPFLGLPKKELGFAKNVFES